MKNSLFLKFLIVLLFVSLCELLGFICCGHITILETQYPLIYGFPTATKIRVDMPILYEAAIYSICGLVFVEIGYIFWSLVIKPFKGENIEKLSKTAQEHNKNWRDKGKSNWH